MSHVDVKNLKPSNFEGEYYDKYEYYNLTDKYTEGSAPQDCGEAPERGEESQGVNAEGDSDGSSRIPTLASMATERDVQTAGSVPALPAGRRRFNLQRA
ncbi:hypothetical protein EPR50_G00164300 [Perca flavescens]|uniref:Uncharacterized protein n=1 Tax=Perca flavescens TaxID=8167 RepID=A0A484CI09_PERFV|nr:hypothetical protein EPR50_G00164300 [Perca flavescens]